MATYFWMRVCVTLCVTLLCIVCPFPLRVRGRGVDGTTYYLQGVEEQRQADREVGIHQHREHVAACCLLYSDGSATTTTTTTTTTPAVVTLFGLTVCVCCLHACVRACLCVCMLPLCVAGEPTAHQTAHKKRVSHQQRWACFQGSCGSLPLAHTAATAPIDYRQ